MPLWSLTYERLERLKAAIDAKKAEHDELEALSEKDLWCRDLDAFVEEWENQLKLDAEIQTNIRRMGRRVSKKIGAGSGKSGGRRIKDEEDYEPAAKKTKAAAKPKPVETKTHQRFAEMFGGKPKPKPTAASKAVDGPADDDDDDFSDDDFASLGKVKKPAVPVASQSESTNGAARSKRAAASVAATKAKTYLLSDDDDLSDDEFAALGKTSASRSSEPKASESASQSADEDVVMTDAPPKRATAAKAKTYLLDSDSDDLPDDKLGDVGALVKGISAPAANGNGGRLSLFAMSQTNAAGGASAALPRMKSKPSRTFDFDSHDDTNYEALAMSSPRKSTKGDDIDDFLSDDDLPVSKPAAKPKAVAAAPQATAAPAPAKKPRGRPAGVKNKSKEASVEPAAKPKPIVKAKRAPAAPKPAALSPAAKAYLKKRPKLAMSDDDEDMDDFGNDDSLAEVAPRARARPGRAAAAKAKPIVLDDSEFDEPDDDKSDAFAMDDDSD
jgi:DNA topoisomerase-2